MASKVTTDMLEVTLKNHGLANYHIQFTPWVENADGSLPGITGESFDRASNSILVTFRHHYFSYLPAHMYSTFSFVSRRLDANARTNFLMEKTCIFDLGKNQVKAPDANIPLGLPEFPILNDTLAPVPTRT
jgi:hypothetical protein